MNNFKKNEQQWKEAMVVSSFYQSPDGSNTVRSYEIVNSNNNVKKIHKSSLEDLRLENFASDAFHNFLNFFGGKPSNVNIKNKGAPEIKKSEQEANSVPLADPNIAPGGKFVSHHTRNDGSLLTVTAFDLTKQKGSELALQDFVRRQAVLKRELERAKVESRREFTEKWMETDYITSAEPKSGRQSRRFSDLNKVKNNPLQKTRNRSIDNGGFRNEKAFYDAFNESSYDGIYHNPYMASSKNFTLSVPPMPCNCIECAARLRAGLPTDPLYQCNCVDCMLRKQSYPPY